MKKNKIMTILDIVELMCYVVLLIVFTINFKVISTDIRYLFLAGDIFVIFSFSKTLDNLDKSNCERVTKNSYHKVSDAYLKLN
jgi:hypothetical protein